MRCGAQAGEGKDLKNDKLLGNVQLSTDSPGVFEVWNVNPHHSVAEILGQFYCLVKKSESSVALLKKKFLEKLKGQALT